MSNATSAVLSSLALTLVLAGASGCRTVPGARDAAYPPARPPALRFGWVTGLKPEQVARYKELHAAAWPGVLRMIRSCHLRNYSIYLKEIEGRPYLFSYVEYTGADFTADMRRMAADPETQRWWQQTDPCQQPLPDAAAQGKTWSDMEEVYHFDGAVDALSGRAQRYGMLTGLKFEKEAWYRILHQTPWPGVNRQIKAANIRNYSIYLKKIGDQLFLFSYFEYAGKSFDTDMEQMKRDDVTQRWWQQTDPCQQPLPAAAAQNKIWDGMDEVFHTD